MFGFSGFTINKKEHLESSAQKLYIACSEYSDFRLFKKRFLLNDTFAAWVDVLHVSRVYQYRTYNSL